MSMDQKSVSILSRMTRMMKDDAGNVAMILGLAALPMFLALGVAIDTIRATREQTAFQAAVDAAAVAVAADAKSDLTSLTVGSAQYVTRIADLKTLATKYINADFASSTGSNTVTLDDPVINGATIKLIAHNNFPTAIMGLFGTADMTLNTTSIVKKGGINVEVSMVLDNTTSMTGTPIANLKTAAKNFVDKVMPATQGLYYMKIAAIPYQQAVNVGALANSARGIPAVGTSTISGSQNFKFTNADGISKTIALTNCVSERTGTAAYTDASFTVSPVGKAYLSPTDGNPCGVQEIMPLGTDGAALKTKIDSLAAGGSTAGQVGIAWGWYALSPNVGLWSGTSVPAGYDKLTTNDPATKVKKVMILMTDGEYNSAYVNGVISANPYVSGSGSTAQMLNSSPTNGDVYSQSNSMCAAIKASGIEVYVITFQLDKSKAARVALANNCATDSGHVLDADTTSLNTAFNAIADNIQALRLAQ